MTNITKAFSTIVDTGKLDEFFLWMYERHKIHTRRRAGEPPPWTNDPIMQNNKFCNVFRIWDRNTQFLVTEVLEKGDPDPIESVFRLILFRFFNRISTWELLMDKIGELTRSSFGKDQYIKVLRHALTNDNKKLYTGAYIIPSPKLFPGLAFENHMFLLQQFKDERVFQKVLECNDMFEAHTLLTSYPGIGSFIGYQLVTFYLDIYNMLKITHRLTLDICMLPGVNWPENEFTALGPGSIAGVKIIFKNIQSDFEGAVRYLHETQNDHWSRLNISDIPSLDRKGYPSGVSLPDVEHSLCEFAKYSKLKNNKSAKQPVRSRTLHFLDANSMSYKLPIKWCHPSVGQNVEEPATPENPASDPPQSDSDDSDVYEISRIVAQRIIRRGGNGKKRRKVTQYRVRWTGYQSEDDTWLEGRRLRNAQEVLSDWKASLPE